MAGEKEKIDNRSRVGWAVLAIAAAAAIGGVGYRAWQDDNAAVPAATSPAGGELSIEQLKAKADANPRDSRAWQALASAYMQREDYPDASRAWRQAIEGDPRNAALWSALGEARVYESREAKMPPGASEAFAKALAIDPTEPRARYFLAVKKDLDGDHRGAIDDWLALLRDTPPGAPWEADLRRTIEQVGQINKIDTAARIAAAEKQRPQPALSAGNAIPGPSSNQMAAATAIPPGEQRDMAESMVARLEGRLKADPKNVDGWVMLMRSRMTLGQGDKAKAALASAIEANPADAARLRQEAAALGVV
jgi:cytochrome c-type biogenesis protein CcmH